MTAATVRYDAAAFPVRKEFAEAHGRFWDRLAGPGAWWTGAERVAIAAEVRNAPRCALCRERKAAVSPNAVRGEHDQLAALPAPAVDVIHRVRNDPARLTRRWLDGVLADGLGVEAYVESVGTLVALLSIASVGRGIGLPLPPLPQPRPGEPSRRRPSGAAPEEAWVPMIAPANATGDEADLYAGARFVPNVIRAMSAVPDEVRTLRELSKAHYLPVGNVADPKAGGYSLSRPQMELIAGRVSALNECFY